MKVTSLLFNSVTGKELSEDSQWWDDRLYYYNEDGQKVYMTDDAFFILCFQYAREQEMFLRVADQQNYYEAEIKDYENEYEPHPSFKSADIKDCVFLACEYISTYKRD